MWKSTLHYRPEWLLHVWMQTGNKHYSELKMSLTLKNVTLYIIHTTIWFEWWYMHAFFFTIFTLYCTNLNFTIKYWAKVYADMCSDFWNVKIDGWMALSYCRHWRELKNEDMLKFCLNICTFISTGKLYRDRKTYIRLWIAIGRKTCSGLNWKVMHRREN